MARHRPRRRLRDHRRRRGRHRRRAADLHRLGLAALPARLRPGLLDLRRDAGCTSDVVFIGAGKLGLPDNAIVAFALGCDMVNVAREAMLAIGCIQAQKCHTDTCPTGVATQNAWLAHGLDPALKSVRAANYVRTLRRDLLKVAEACGVEHPGLIDTGSVEVLTGRTASTPLRRGLRLRGRLGPAVGRRPRRDRPPHDRRGPAGRLGPAVTRRRRLTRGLRARRRALAAPEIDCARSGWSSAWREQVGGDVLPVDASRHLAAMVAGLNAVVWERDPLHLADPLRQRADRGAPRPPARATGWPIRTCGGGACTPTTSDRVLRAVIDAVEARADFALTYRIRSAAGRLLWVHHLGHVAGDGDGRAAGPARGADRRHRRSDGGRRRPSCWPRRAARWPARARWRSG